MSARISPGMPPGKNIYLLQARYPPPDAAFCEKSDGLLIVALVPHELLHALPSSPALNVLDLRVSVRQAQEKLETVKLFGGARVRHVCSGGGTPAVLGCASFLLSGALDGNRVPFIDERSHRGSDVANR